MQRAQSSFHDPSGHVYISGKEVLRSIRQPYSEEWQTLKSNGLLEKAIALGMISFRELPRTEWPQNIVSSDPEIRALLSSPKLPFISWPSEWCFSQLKAAALLTLDLHMLALEHGCILKDASAYNIQFLDSKPIFIDVLSFERWKDGQPWQAYGQFCNHFLAPLALMSYKDLRLGLLTRQWIDGIPLDLASSLLPLRSRLSPGLAMHVHLHAKMRDKYSDGREAASKVQKTRMNIKQLRNVAESLKSLITSLRVKEKTSEWGDYYSDTNYTEAARQEKSNIIQKFAGSGNLALDLGANTGEFSKLAAQNYKLVLSTDYDALAVEKNWRSKRPENVLPLILDIAQPTPGYGFQCEERNAFVDRCEADLLLALALCHHLIFSFGIPLEKIAQSFRNLLKPGGRAIVEFVPKTDSQVRRLLAARDDIFTEYTREKFLAAFRENGFTVAECAPLPESEREIVLFKRQ